MSYQLYFRRKRRKTQNDHSFELKPNTSCLPVLRAETLDLFSDKVCRKLFLQLILTYVLMVKLSFHHFCYFEIRRLYLGTYRCI